jgi:hypothetical protein
MTIEDYHIFSGTSTVGSGTVTLNGTVNVVGATSAFLTQLSVGSVLEVNGEARVVVTIADNTHCTVSTAFLQTASAQAYTIYQMINVEDVSADLLPPAGAYVPFSRPTPLLDGTVRGMGWATATWKWGWLALAQRNALKALCAGVSVETFIKMPDDARVTRTYRAVLVWPAAEQYYANTVLDFTLSFRRLEVL